MITTTPKPIKLLKDIIVDPSTVVTRASSYENRGNLAPAFFDSIIRKYEGTRLGRQELEAELLEDIPGALWTRAIIDAYRCRLEEVRWDLLTRIVVAIDPAGYGFKLKTPTKQESSSGGASTVGQTHRCD